MFKFRRSSRVGLMRMYGSVKTSFMHRARRRYAGNIVRSANRNRILFKKGVFR